ncbi:MAG: hypothetical protein ABUS79_21925 [Pseudomonadota bacterium]
MRTAFVCLFAVVTVAWPAATPARAETPRGAASVSVNMTLVESSGATLAVRNVDVAVGGSETVTVQQPHGRSVSVQTTVSAGAKAGCYKVDLVVRDRRIDATGRFNKTVWQSATEPCDAEPITLGPKDETQVRISLRRRR